MPAWLLIVCAGVGAVLVFSEIVIRMVTTLRAPKGDAVALGEATSRLELVRATVNGARNAWKATTPDPAEVEEMKAAFVTIKGYLPADPTDTKRGVAGDGGWLGSLLSGVTRQNVFLGVGLVLLLVPALIAGGFNVGFDRFSDTPVATPSPAR